MTTKTRIDKFGNLYVNNVWIGCVDEERNEIILFKAKDFDGEGVTHRSKEDTPSKYVFRTPE
jgi:hypothetical protein